jgi:adenine-specific DNA-methyltransferase
MTLKEPRQPSSEAAPPASQLPLPWPETDGHAPEFVEIQSRRYLGSKSRLLPFLHRIVAEVCGPFQSFGDLFAGTGVVAHSFNRPEVQILANDYLASNAVSLSCWLGMTDLSLKDAAGLIAYLNALPSEDENYVSEQYGNRYFSPANARKIGTIRDEVDRLNLPKPLRDLALTSLLYAMDRVAHTVGHYDAFRQRSPLPADADGNSGDHRDRPLRLLLPRVDPQKNAGNEIFCEDANALIRRIEVDVLYLDPPYNSRQYSDTYHVLENILLNDKPSLIGIARKRPGRPSRSRYCGKEAPAALEELIQNARCRWVLFSYNNMCGGDKRSNAILTPDQIEAILRERGTLQVFETPFNSFTAKRELIPGHVERVYVCRVARPKSEVRGPKSEVGFSGLLPLAPTGTD